MTVQGYEKTKQIPIVFVTEISQDEQNVYKEYDLGAVDYLFKPIASDILRSKVKVFFQLYRQQQELRREVMERQKALMELEAKQQELRAEISIRIEAEKEAQEGELRIDF